MKSRFYLLILFVAFLFSCEENPEGKAHYMEEDVFFVARLGDTYHTKTTSFLVTQVADSRCPQDVTCCLAGDVVVHFTVQGNPRIDTSLSLFNSKIFVDPVFFELKSVTPTRYIRKKVKQNNYRIEMKVSGKLSLQ